MLSIENTKRSLPPKHSGIKVTPSPGATSPLENGHLVLEEDLPEGSDNSMQR